MAELQDLIDVIKESNGTADSRLHEVERHTRNSRRHLLEMKKETFRMSENIAAMAEVQPPEPPPAINEGEQEENKRERKAFEEKQLGLMQDIANGLRGQKESSAAGSKKGMGIKGLIGAAVGLGIIAVIGAVAAAVVAIANVDFQKVKDSLASLLSIADDVGGTGNMFLEGGTFFLVMTGIGLGLGVFAAGSAAAAAADYFSQEGWVQSVKYNVKELLSISDLLGGKTEMLLEGGTFMLAMTGVGLGLAAFSAGAGVAAAIDYFSSEGWAQSVKDSVLTLLSISDSLGGAAAFIGEGASFFLAMTGIGAGLAVFGAGAAVAGLSDALLNFTNSDWAQGIVDNVGILLSIADIPMGDTAKFVATMGGISAGLVAFGASSGFAGIVSYFLGDEIPKIKKNALDLVSMVDEMGDDPVAKSDAFRTAITNLGSGLSSFAGGNFAASLKNLGASILDFFSGGESPIDSVMKVADKADQLDKGTTAIAKLADALEKISGFSFDGSKLGLEDLAEDLLKSIPAIETAINGGVVGEGWISSGTTIKGLASDGVDFQSAVDNMNLLKEATMSLSSAQAQAFAAASPAPTIVNNYYDQSSPANNTVIQNTPARSRPSAMPGVVGFGNGSP